MQNIIHSINEINWTEGYIDAIIYSNWDIINYSLFIFCTDGELNQYLIQCINFNSIQSTYPPTGITDIIIEENILEIKDFSILSTVIEADKFQLYDISNIEIKNPYQILIDLGLIK